MTLPIVAGNNEGMHYVVRAIVIHSAQIIKLPNLSTWSLIIQTKYRISGRQTFLHVTSTSGSCLRSQVGYLTFITIVVPLTRATVISILRHYLTISTVAMERSQRIGPWGASTRCLGHDK